MPISIRMLICQKKQLEEVYVDFYSCHAHLYIGMLNSRIGNAYREKKITYIYIILNYETREYKLLSDFVPIYIIN